MNKIEKSIVDGLNGITNKKLEWKLFSSRYVNSNMELKGDKEKKLYDAICEFLKEKDAGISVLPIKSFMTMFVDWKNEKVIESINTLVTVKDIEKALKYYFLKNHLKLNRYFCLTVNSKDNVFITSVCRECGIYQIKDKTEKNETSNNEEKKESKSGLDAMDKIAVMINSINSLSKGMTVEEKNSIVDMLKKSLGLTACKVEKTAKTA